MEQVCAAPELVGEVTKGKAGALSNRQRVQGHLRGRRFCFLCSGWKPPKDFIQKTDVVKRSLGFGQEPVRQRECY